MNRPSAEDALPEKSAVRCAFDRAAESFDAACVVHDEARQRLIERLDFFRLEPELILDLGCATGRASRALAQRYPGARVLGLDASSGMLGRAKQTCDGNRLSLVRADAESLPLRAGTVQLAFANLCLPFCRPDRVFAEMARVLAPGGLFAFSTVGPDTLQEVRRAWAKIDGGIHVHAAFDMHDLGDLALANGLAEPVVDVDRLTLTYGESRALTKDLRDCGAVNTAAGRRRGLTGTGRWRTFESALGAGRGPQERLEVSIELVLGQAWGRGPKAGPRRAAEVAVPVEQIGRRGSG